MAIENILYMNFTFNGASNFAADVDNTFVFIIGISLFFLIGITTTMIVFAIKYNKKKHPQASQFKDNMYLEVIWTVVPLILVLFMFYYGFHAFSNERNIPKDAMPIKVISKMWDWTFDYGDNKFSKDTLVVPLKTAVRLNLTSLDVNHSFYIPAFRIKEDAVPGQTTEMWFIAERTGIFEILCAEYCGLRHSYMMGWVKVVEEPQYKNWLASVKSIDPNAVPKGLLLMQKNACIGCHSLDGTKLVGPSLKGLYNTQRLVVTDGKEHSIVADSAYIKNSILNPDKDVVKGFNTGLMKSYRPLLKDEEVSEIVSYLKETSGKK